MKMLEETWDKRKVLAFLQEVNAKTVFFDVDNTIIGKVNGLNPFICNMRPQAVETLKFLHEEGFRVFLWSAGGKEHCDNVVAFEDLQFIENTFRKPEFPMQLDDVIRTIGFKPDVTVDNDISEQVEGIPFIECSTFWGKLD